MTFSIGFVAGGSGNPETTAFNDTTTQTGATTLQEIVENVEGRVDTLETFPALATLTKSFLQNEGATLTLSASATSPEVAVTKEVAQVGITDNRWDISSDLYNYDIEDSAPATTLTPSATTGTITLTLGTGNFTSADNGKRVYGNGGVAAIINGPTGAAAVLTAFNDTSAIASGEWELSAIGSDGTSIGIFPQSTGGYASDSAAVATTFTIATVEDGLFVDESGTRLYLTDFNNDIFQYSMTGGDVTTRSLVNTVRITGATNLRSIWFSPDGAYCYTASQNSPAVISRWDLPTPWDITSLDPATASQTLNPSVGDGMKSAQLSDNGEHLYLTDTAVGRAHIKHYTLGTAWDLTTASLTETVAYASFGASIVYAIAMHPGGNQFSFPGWDGSTNRFYRMSTSVPYSVAAGNISAVGNVTSGATYDANLCFALSGTKMYSVDSGVQFAEFTSAFNVAATGEYYAAVTNVSGEIDTTYWTDLTGATLIDEPNAGEVYYAFSVDNGNYIIITASGTRNIVRNNAGTWEVNTNAAFASETWAAASANSVHTALKEAASTASNRMVAADVQTYVPTQLTLGNSLGTAVIVKIPAVEQSASSQMPVLTYTANVRNDAAQLKVDYDYDQPALDKIRVQSLKAQNLKIRVG